MTHSHEMLLLDYVHIEGFTKRKTIQSYLDLCVLIVL